MIRAPPRATLPWARCSGKTRSGLEWERPVLLSPPGSSTWGGSLSPLTSGCNQMTEKGKKVAMGCTCDFWMKKRARTESRVGIMCSWEDGWLSGKESICQCRRCKKCRFDVWVEMIPWGREWKPTPVFLPIDRGTWRATVHGVAKSQLWLRN